MGQYKVPQDVEAEDKIIGPLTMRQFIYAVIGVVWGLLSYVMFKSLPVIMILVGIPPTLLFLLLAFYRRQDQPFEAYFIALVNFIGRPRKRLWEKEPIGEVFKVEAPKIKPEEARRDPREVRGQLERLARVIDTRGYAAKQPEIQEPGQMPALEIDDRDRLAIPNIAPTNPLADVSDVHLADDILDFKNNPNAQNLDSLIADSEKNIREEALAKMNDPKAAVSQSIQPATPQKQPTTSGMTPNPVADILKLAMENDDLTVSQIAHQANKELPMQEGQAVSLRDATNTNQ